MDSLENREDIDIDQSGQRWFIDLEWYQQNNRSFAVLTQGCLCPRCHKRLKADECEVSVADILSATKDCCSLASDFITSRVPILESAFRLFLANGNQPLDLEELGKQLGERRGGDAYRTSAEVLSRLLAADRYYGLRQVSD